VLTGNWEPHVSGRRFSLRRLLVPAQARSSQISSIALFSQRSCSGIPQTKAGCLPRGPNQAAHVLGKFFCCSTSSLAHSARPRRASVQVGAGIASVLARRIGLGPEKSKPSFRRRVGRSGRASTLHCRRAFALEDHGRHERPVLAQWSSVQPRMIVLHMLLEMNLSFTCRLSAGAWC